MRRILILLVALALAPSAFAGCRGPQGLPLPGPSLSPIEGEFHYSPEQGLGCVVSSQQGAAMAKHESAITFLPCLRVGPVAIGETRASIEALLGEAAGVIDLDLFSESRVYEVAQRGVLRPHYVVTYRDEQVVAVQLLGPPMQIAARFSGLTLGDDQQKVIDTLGWPQQRCQGKADGPELWTWLSFPIAVDIIDGYVAGFKVTWPAGK